MQIMHHLGEAARLDRLLMKSEHNKLYLGTFIIASQVISFG